MASELQRLPPGFHTGVTEDGRIFFINDLDRTTSWLHPVSQLPILTGLHSSSDLPPGWEVDTTLDGRVFYVDHNRGLTTFLHPHHGQRVVPSHSQQGSISSQQSPPPPHSPQDPYPGKENFKRGTAKQRSVKAPSAKRNPNSEVIKSGWLHRLESSGLSKSWKKRWIVLADFALFIYKDNEESTVLSSILLPSYRINPCTDEDNIKRNFVFKVEHENTKTVYLATDDSPELVSWMSLLRQSAMMNGSPGFQREPNNNYNRQHPFKDANRDPMRDTDSRHSTSHNPRDIMDSNPNLNSASKHPNNIRPYNPHENVSANFPQNNRFSNASQSSSYQGYYDPASSPVTPPTESRPRIGGVYPFIHQQGQRRSYVSQGGSNRNSLATSPQNPVNVSQVYPVSREPNYSAFTSPHDHRAESERDQYTQGRSGDNQYPTPDQSQTRLKDGFEPDSVRSSYAQSDAGHSYPALQNDSFRRDVPHGMINGDTSYNNVPSERDWSRDQHIDSHSDIHDGGEVKQLQQWDRNLPAMGAETMKHGSFHNLLDGVGRPQEETFNVRSKSHENFSRPPDRGQNQAHYPNGNNPYQSAANNEVHNNTSPGWNRLPSGCPESQRSSMADSYRKQEPHSQNVTEGQSFNDYPRPDRQEGRGSFNPLYGMSPQRKGDMSGLMEPRYRDSYDRNSNSSFIQQSRNEPVSSETPRYSQSHIPYAPSGQYQQSSPHEERTQPFSSHVHQNSFNSYERDANEVHFHPDQRWRDASFSSGSARGQPNQHQQQQNFNQPQRPNMHLELNNQPDSSHPNPHTYANLPSRKSYDGQTSQQMPDNYQMPQRHNLSNDFAHNNSSHNSSLEQPPARPPYPAAVRDQIVEEMAQVQTPSTQKDFLISTELNKQRMQQPSFFQYPSPRDQPDRNSPQDLDGSRLSQRSVEANLAANAPNSRLSSASRASHSSRGRDQRDGQQPLQGDATSAKRNMMDPEAQKMRLAYERVQSLRLSPEKAQKRPGGSLTQRNSGMPPEQSPVKPPRVLSQVHRDYKSQDELDAVGVMPPPRGSYCKIRDDSEDLYQRGSAFRPPSSMSGSQLGTDSLQRMKKFSNTMPLNRSMDYNDDQGRPYHRTTEKGNRADGNHQHKPNNDLNEKRNFENEGRKRGRSVEEHFDESHLFFDPYGTAFGLLQEKQSLKLAAPPKRKALPIHTVKEDPDMPDRDVLETDLQKVVKKNPLQGSRLRMSICAGDLIGKTHDELVLLLIQLRRNQSALEKTRDFYKQQIEQRKPGEMEYRRQFHRFGEVQDGRLHNAHLGYMEAKGQTDEIEKKLEVYRPIINLLDNMVTMGSLYGGDNYMLATQYRKHLLRPDQYQAPKKMLEFSRQHQEDRLIQETNEEIKQLSADEVNLEEKIDRLNEIDRLLQEQSFKVSSFKEDKELMERALAGIFRQQDEMSNDQWEMRRLTQQQRTLEKEISRVTQLLAEASKELEETTAENNKLEHEVALLRTKVHGELTRSRSAPSLASESMRTKMKMEKELAKVQDIMQGLNQQGAKLSQAMKTLRRSSSGTQLAGLLDDEGNENMPSGTYLQTDLDSGDQVDLARSGQAEHSSPAAQPFISHQRQNASEPDDWNTDEGDENTRKFFGLGPRDKIKGQTVRDVKRLSEARRERKKEEDDYGEEIKLQVSNVDTEDTSFIQARIAGDLKSRPGAQPWESGHPLYENLPRYGSMPALADNQSASSSRRSSIILMAPKPFTPYQDKSTRPFKSEFSLDFANGVNRYPQSTLNQPEKERNLTNQYQSEDVMKSENAALYQSQGGIKPKQLEPGLQFNCNYLTPENQSEPSSLYSQGQFHAKPLTIQPLNCGSRNEMQFTQDEADGQRQQMRTFGGNLTQANDLDKQQSQPYTVKPWTRQEANSSEDALQAKKNPRGRYLTISSSQPLKMETNSLLNPTLHSSAGDLILNRSIDDVPDIVKSSQTKVDQIDEDVIDREILYVPDKVLIPERYDAEADAEQLTEEDKMRRREKAEKIKKVLTSQSVLSISQPDISHLPATEVHNRVELEKKERAHFLALNQELARQVTQQSKKQAAERRKTWSGAQFADVKKQYEEQFMNSSGSPLRSPSVNRKRAEITMRDI